MVAHRNKIGVKRRGFARVGLAAEHHRQRIGGMARSWIGCDGVVALHAPDQGAGNHRKRADNGGLVREAGFRAKARDCRAEAVDNR